MSRSCANRSRWPKRPDPGRAATSRPCPGGVPETFPRGAASGRVAGPMGRPGRARAGQSAPPTAGARRTFHESPQSEDHSRGRRDSRLGPPHRGSRIRSELDPGAHRRARPEPDARQPGSRRRRGRQRVGRQASGHTRDTGDGRRAMWRTALRAAYRRRAGLPAPAGIPTQETQRSTRPATRASTRRPMTTSKRAGSSRPSSRETATPSGSSWTASRAPSFAAAIESSAISMTPRTQPRRHS